MPRNPNKKHCRVEGCRAWAKRGQEVCSSHLYAGTLPALTLAFGAPGGQVLRPSGEGTDEGKRVLRPSGEGARRADEGEGFGPPPPWRLSSPTAGHNLHGEPQAEAGEASEVLAVQEEEDASEALAVQEGEDASKVLAVQEGEDASKALAVQEGEDASKVLAVPRGALQQLRSLIERLRRQIDEADTSLKDGEVIEQELRNLFAARALFLGWIESAGEQGADPAQFLRAWNDSAGRVMQLLRTRKVLAGEQEGAWGPLLQAVYDNIEVCVPVLQPKNEEAQGATAPPVKGER